MSILQVYSKRVVALLVIFAVANLALHAFRGFVGAWGYIIGLPTLVVVFVVLIVRQYFKDFPEGAGAASEKSMVMNAALERVCEAIPGVIARNHWRLLKADEEQGHFGAKIGMSIWTWGEIMLIDVSKTGERSAKVNVHCGTPKQLYDWYKKIDKDIDKFFRGLENSIENSKA